MYDVVVVAFDSADKAQQALGDLQEISAGAGYAVIQAGLVKQDAKDLMLVDVFTGQGVDDQFMGLAAKTVVVAGANEAEGTVVAELASAMKAATAALVATVYDPDQDSFDAFFDPYGGTVQRWDLREVQKAVHADAKAEGAAYREAHREERQELRAEHKEARKEAFEEFKKDVNL